MDPVQLVEKHAPALEDTKFREYPIDDEKDAITPADAGHIEAAHKTQELEMDEDERRRLTRRIDMAVLPCANPQKSRCREMRV